MINVKFCISVMSKFAQRVDVAVDALASNSAKDVDENDFIDASRLVYDGVREIRRAVLMNRVSTISIVDKLQIYYKFPNSGNNNIVNCIKSKLKVCFSHFVI